MSDTPNTLWVKGYTADGYQVGITVALDPANLAQWIADALDAIRAAGIRPRELGTEAGEDVHTLAYVVRRSKDNGDGSETPIVDLYNDVFDFRVVGVYLNTADDVREFTRATGLTLDSIPLFDSNAPIQRTDPKFTKRAATVNSKPQFAIKRNPRWDDSKTPTENKVPKHLFARWLGAGAPAPVTETKSERLARELDEERPDHLKPENPVLTDKQFIATAIQKKSKNGKEWYVLLSEDKSTFATSWGLSEYNVFSEEDRAEFDDYEEHRISRMVVTWKPNKDFKNVTKLEWETNEYGDIPF